MPLLWIIAIVLVLAVIGYVLARQRALASADGDSRHLHSLPVYYGSNAAIKTAVPALLVLVLWLIAQPLVVNSQIAGMIPESEIAEGSNMNLVMSEVRRTATGIENAIAAGTLTEDQVATAGMIWQASRKACPTPDRSSPERSPRPRWRPRKATG